jgi:hypothetical protein
MTGIALLMASTALATSLTVTPSTTVLTTNLRGARGSTGSVSVAVTNYATPLATKPLTYSWAIDNPFITIDNPSSSATAFSVDGMLSGEKRVGNAVCTVNQAASGLTGQSAPVKVTISRY